MKKIQVISSSNCKNCELLYEVVNTIVKKRGIDAQVAFFASSRLYIERPQMLA